VLDAGRRAFFESGCGLVLGLADADGRPHAQRGWGARVDPEVPDVVRVMVPANDEHLLRLLVPGARIAVTGTDVRTLHGLQMKGRVLRTDAGGPADDARMLRYRDEFFGAIVDLDGIPRELLERMTPTCFLACEIEIDAVFDQTPGPNAGRPAEDVTE
jgi:hypothetical protein